MEIHDVPPKPNVRDKKEYREWRAKYKHLLVDKLYGIGPFQIINYNGFFYAKDVGAGDCLFYLIDQRQESPPEFDILCGCGNNKFILTYGEYQLIAECIECGTSDVVYDG